MEIKKTSKLGAKDNAVFLISSDKDVSSKYFSKDEITYIKKTVERSPVAFGPKEVLIERQETGAINMYNHFIEQNTNIEMPLVHVIYIEKENNELVNVTKANYKKVRESLDNCSKTITYRIGNGLRSRNLEGNLPILHLHPYCRPPTFLQSETLDLER